MVWAVSAAKDYRKPLGNSIREQRVKAGLTQEALAEMAELHHNFVGRVERGEEYISLAALLRISRGLGITLSSLVKDLR